MKLFGWKYVTFFQKNQPSLWLIAIVIFQPQTSAFRLLLVLTLIQSKLYELFADYGVDTSKKIGKSHLSFSPSSFERTQVSFRVTLYTCWPSWKIGTWIILLVWWYHKLWHHRPAVHYHNACFWTNLFFIFTLSHSYIGFERMHVIWRDNIPPLVEWFCPNFHRSRSRDNLKRLIKITTVKERKWEKIAAWFYLNLYKK